MKNNRTKKPSKSKVYTQKKPSKKIDKKKNKASIDTGSIKNVNYIPSYYKNVDTYTTSNSKNTTYINVSGEDLPQTYTTAQTNTLYYNVDGEETETKRSSILPTTKDNSNANLIIMLVGAAAFVALLLLLI